MRLIRFTTFSIFVFLLTACNFSLAADVTPPPGYQPEVVVETPAVELAGPLYPLVPPNPAGGEAIFAEKCSPCHGPTGMGNGSLADRLPFPASPVGDPELARLSTPAEWYRVVSQGRMERSMPPFSSLTNQERWDVVGYLYTLSTTADTLAQGAGLYQENCAGCHGGRGRGDGPDAAGLSSKLQDLADPEFLAGKSSADFFQTITAGVPPEMPAFGDQLSEVERWAIGDYLRSQLFTPDELAANTAGTPGAALLPGGTPEPESTLQAGGSSSPEIESTPVVTQTNSTGTIQGAVINASGGEVPQGLQVTLHGFDEMQTVITATTQLENDGTYSFQDIEMPEGRVFLATVDFDGATYGSEIGSATSGTTNLDFPITVFETTSDPSGLVVDRLHLFFEFADPGTLRVIELYVISNTGNQTVIPPAEGEPAIKFVLPEAATNLEFQDGVLGGRYIQTADGFGDTAAIRPGTGNYQVLFAFQMPYEQKLDLVQPMTLPANAVVILAPEGNVKVKGEAVQDAGVRDMQGAKYQMYNSSSLAAGESLALTITGHPSAGGSALSLGSESNLMIGLAGLGVALVLAGFLLYRRSRLATAEDEAYEEEDSLLEDDPENADTIMDAILALDDLYKAGELPEEAYRQRRADLKEKLRDLMTNDRSS